MVVSVVGLCEANNRNKESSKYRAAAGKSLLSWATAYVVLFIEECAGKVVVNLLALAAPLVNRNAVDSSTE